MIAAFFNLIAVFLVVFCILSYVLCGYVTFFHTDERLEKVSTGVKIMLWLLSPLVVLDVIMERTLGWSFMS